MRIRLCPCVMLAASVLAASACATPAMRVRPLDPGAPVAHLWAPPTDLAERDLFNGAWGANRAPDPAAVYTLVEIKRTGINPGVTVRDPAGRQWSVKLSDPDISDTPEGPIEVVMSRLLSAVGYYQPPVYYLPAFSLRDDWGTHVERGGRFRLKDKTLKELDTWSWHENPFFGSPPYQGLIAILMLFNSSDIKDANNSLYEHRTENGKELWYMVRDLGTALGTTGRLAPRRGDLAGFQKSEFIHDVQNGFVVFDYHGRHQELVRGRITPADVGWACTLMSGLSDRQWHDAFRAGGYERAVADAYIQALYARIALGRAVAATGQMPARDRR